MRILQLVALFTTLFVTRGGCRPNNPAEGPDYAADGTDYFDDYNEATLPDNPSSVSISPFETSHIYTKPMKMEVYVGDVVHLPCNVSNSNDVTVVWKKGLEPLYSDELSYLSGSEKQRIVRQNNNTLVIYNFKETDVSDNYICQITNSIAEKVVHSVQLKKDVRIWPDTQIKVEYSETDVKIRCIPNWKPSPKITWTRMGIKLASDSSPADGSSLTIKNVTVNDAGLYQCVVEIDGKSDPIVKAINIIAYHSPIVEVEDEMVHTGIHMDAELTCKVSAYPQAQVTWYKNEQRVSAGGTRKIESPDLVKSKHTLVLSRIEKENFGKYMCEATNSIGKAWGIVELTGVPRPAVLKQGKVSGDGTTPILEWEVKSYTPILEYELKYRHVGDEKWQIVSPGVTDDSTSNTFEISYPLKNLKAGDYEAMLTARNEFGWSSAPLNPYRFHGENVVNEPDIVAESKSGAALIKSLFTPSLLLLAVSFFVYATTYL